MAGLFTADIENRGLVLDPRTKLFVMIALVVFVLGGTGSDIETVRYGTIAVSILPPILLMTAKQYRKAAVFGMIFALVKCAELYLVPNITGAALSIIGLCCLIFVRLMPCLIMGAYMLSYRRHAPDAHSAADHDTAVCDVPFLSDCTGRICSDQHSDENA